jgi:hypothetical protein
MAPRYHPDLPTLHSASLYVCFACSCFVQKHVHCHTLAGNGASRHGLQTHTDLSTCDFEVIFNARAMLVSQLRQFSVIASRAYSSSTTSSLFCKRRILYHFLLIVAVCFKVTKNPWLSGVVATLLSPSSRGNYKSSAGIGTLSRSIARGVVGFHRAVPSTHLDESRYEYIFSYYSIVLVCLCYRKVYRRSRGAVKGNLHKPSAVLAGLPGCHPTPQAM